MAHKPTPHYLLFLLILCSLAADSMVSPIYAASVSIASSRASALQAITNTNNNPPVSVTTREDSDHFYYLTEPTEQYMEPYQEPINESDSDDVPYAELYRLGKQFLTDNEENEFIQNSFQTLKSTKQVFEETDLKIHDVTNNIALSLQLDTPTENNQPYRKQAKDILDKYSADNQLFTLDQGGEDISTNPSGNSSSEAVSDFLKSIFNLRNFAFLAGTVLFFISVIKISRVILLRKNKYLP